MGRFRGMSDSDVGGQGGRYFPPDSQFEVTIEKVFFTNSRKKQDMVIVECKVDVSSNDECPAGVRASYCIKTSYDNFLGMYKAVILACLGVNPTKGADADTGVLKEFLSTVGVETLVVGKKTVSLADVDDLDTLWDAVGEACINEDEKEGAVNPLAGSKCRLETVGVQMQKSDGIFTQHFFSPLA